VVVLETALQYAGFVAEAVIIALLLFRRIHRKLPVFFCYAIWSLIADVGCYLLIRRSPDSAVRIYLNSTIIDSIFMFCVLIEVSMSVLKPARSLLPRWAILAIAGLVLLCSVAAWHFIKFSGWDVLTPEYAKLVHLQITVSAMRILYFLLLASFGQLLAIGWRDRELQIATGFGIFALGSLSVSMLHVNQGLGTPDLAHQYHMVDLLGVVSYLCCLAYWGVCFAQEVPERREFTPQMQRFLVAVAGNAHATRMAMADSSESEAERRSRR